MAVPTTSVPFGQGTYLPWELDDNCTDEEIKAREAFKYGCAEIQRVSGSLGLRVKIEHVWSELTHGSYFVMFKDGGLMTINARDGAYGERNRVNGASSVLEVWERTAQEDPTTITPDALLKLISDRGVLKAVLPPLQLAAQADSSSQDERMATAETHGCHPDAALAVLEDKARVAVRQHLAPHEPTPKYLGTWKWWKVHGSVASGSPMESSNSGDIISFELASTHPLTLQWPLQTATLLIGSAVRVPGLGVYALAIDRVEPPVRASLRKRRCDGGDIHIELRLSGAKKARGS